MVQSTVKQRLIEYLKYKKIGRNRFETMAGISNGYITKLKYAPREEILEKILLNAPDLNRVWLLTGEGDMLNEMGTPPSAASQVSQQTSGDHSHNVNGTGNVIGNACGSALEDMAVALRKALGTIEQQTNHINTLTNLVRDLQTKLDKKKDKKG